jgi:hypothetical protein
MESNTYNSLSNISFLLDEESGYPYILLCKECSIHADVDCIPSKICVGIKVNKEHCLIHRMFSIFVYLY